MARGAARDPAIRLALTPLRASVPQVTIKVDKTLAGNFGLNVGDVYATVQTYLGSSFVNQFTRFGHQYMVYAQADAPFRRQTESVRRLLHPRRAADRWSRSERSPASSARRGPR